MKITTVKRLGLFLILLLSFNSNHSSAQSTPPLIEMLERLPQVLDGEIALIAYADMQVSIESWYGVNPVHSLQEFQALETNEQLLYRATLPRTIPLFMIETAYSDAYTTMSENSGLDFFSIEQSLHLNSIQYEASVTMLNGDFDNETIISRRLEQAYSQAGEDFTILCPPTSCEEDFLTERIDFELNPFIYNHAFLLEDGFFTKLDSPSYLRASLAVLNGEAPSRLAIPSYSASARLLISLGAVSQALFVPPEFIRDYSEFQDASEEIELLPAYQLFTMAELVFAEAEETQVHIILSYETLEDAELAEANLEDNLKNPRISPSRFFDEVDGQFESIEIYEDTEANVFLVHAILSSPFQEPEDRALSNTLFRIFYMDFSAYFNVQWLTMAD